MQDLSGAYNNLEVHSYQLEAQIRRLQNQAGTDSQSAGMKLVVAACILGTCQWQIESMAVGFIQTLGVIYCALVSLMGC